MRAGAVSRSPPTLQWCGGGGGRADVKQGDKMRKGGRREARGGDGTSAIVYSFMYFLPHVNDAFVLTQKRINPRPDGAMDFPPLC